MKILADENIERLVVTSLRTVGFEVASVADVMKSAPDSAVISYSAAGSFILLTQDKGFAESLFVEHKTVSGIVLVRLHGMVREPKAERIIAELNAHRDRLQGHFTVIGPTSVRQRALPVAVGH